MCSALLDENCISHWPSVPASPHSSDIKIHTHTHTHLSFGNYKADSESLTVHVLSTCDQTGVGVGRGTRWQRLYLHMPAKMNVNPGSSDGSADTFCSVLPLWLTLFLFLIPHRLSCYSSFQTAIAAIFPSLGLPQHNIHSFSSSANTAEPLLCLGCCSSTRWGYIPEQASIHQPACSFDPSSGQWKQMAILYDV